MIQRKIWGVAAVLLLTVACSSRGVVKEDSLTIKSSEAAADNEGQDTAAQGLGSTDATTTAELQEALPEGLESQEAADWILARSQKAMFNSDMPALSKRYQRTKTLLPGQAISLTGESYWQAPDKVYVSENMPGIGDIVMAYDGEVGWAEDPIMGLRILEGVELEQMRLMTLESENAYKTAYPTRRYLGTEDIDGHKTYKVELASEIVQPLTRWVDAESFLPRKQKEVAESAQGSMKVVMFFEDWREVDGEMVAFTTRSRIGPMKMTVQVLEVRHDVDVLDAVFEYPSSP